MAIRPSSPSAAPSAPLPKPRCIQCHLAQIGQYDEQQRFRSAGTAQQGPLSLCLADQPLQTDTDLPAHDAACTIDDSSSRSAETDCRLCPGGEECEPADDTRRG